MLRIISLTKLLRKEKKKGNLIALWAVYSTIILAIIVLLIRIGKLYLLPNSILLISYMFTQVHMILGSGREKNKWTIIFIGYMIGIHIFAWKRNYVSTYIAVGIIDIIFLKAFDKLINF